MTPVRPLSITVCLFGALAFGALAGYGVASIQHMYPRYAERVVSGRVEAPHGTEFASLSIVASRNDRTIVGRGMDAAGEFSFAVPGNDPIDLQVGIVSTEHPDPGIRGSLLPLVAGALEGCVRRVPAGSQGVAIRLVPLVAKSITVRVSAAEGGRVDRARVVLWSMADCVEKDADTTGRARFDGLPVRRWRVRVMLPDRPKNQFVYGIAEVTPDDGEVEVRVPAGISFKVRIAGRTPSDVVLDLADPFGPGVWRVPWRPEPDGTMQFVVSREQESVAIRADEYFDRTPDGGYSYRPFAEGAAAIRDGVELTLTPYEH